MGGAQTEGAEAGKARAELVVLAVLGAHTCLQMCTIGRAVGGGQMVRGEAQWAEVGGACSTVQWSSTLAASRCCSSGC